MPLKPKNPDAPARGMLWHYVNAEDGHKISALHFDILKGKVRDYRRLNNYPVGSNFDFDFEQNVCANADSNDCYDESMPPITQRLRTFARAMGSWAASGLKTVSQEDAQKRLEVCEQCPHYNGSSSILKIACKRCGCTGLKLWLPGSVCPDKRW